MAVDARAIAQALGGAKQTPEGYLCKCPCHPDRTSSLSIKVTDKGAILNCFAGCSWQDVLAEIQRRGLVPAKSPRKSNRYEGAKFYQYYDAAGNLLCRKVKMPDKKMWFERYEGNDYIPGLNGMTIPLYNLRKVLECKADEWIYLCEGEKDAESMCARGYVGTTNHAGAKSWAPHLTEQLKDKRVIIIPDNDEPGRKRVALLTKALSGVVKELSVFMPPGVPEHGDITDWLNSGGDPAQIQVEATAIKVKAKTAKAAARVDYVKEFTEVFGELKRDIFSEDLCYLDPFTKLWSPIMNKVRVLRSHVRELSLAGEKAYKAQEVEDHLSHLESSLTPELVVSVPPWDSRDRLLELSQRVILSDEQVALGINEQVFYELLKYWHCKMWQRLYDPTIRNEIFILAGQQNIGKDFWIRENCDALGQYLVNFSIHSNERDTKEQLHRGLVMNISEFDRTSRSEVSLLKEIVTATQTDLRFAYDRRSMTRRCRCSFMASTNVKDIFNDPTGHSRYVYFELKFISKETRFTSEDKLQVLAQGQALAEADYKPSPKSLELMRKQIEGLTPEDEYDAIMDRWDYLATEIWKNVSVIDKQQFKVRDESLQYYGFLPNDVTFETVLQIAKEFAKSPKKVRSTLKLNGRLRVDPNFGRGYYFKLAVPSQTFQDSPI